METMTKNEIENLQELNSFLHYLMIQVYNGVKLLK